MTTPSDGGSFEYTDDSVIAKVSVDVPSQAITDINQLSEAMAAMREQLAAVADAQGQWLGFLQQMPQSIGATNDAIKEQITLLERQAYAQGEAGGRGGAFTSGPGGAGGASPGSYSTAAPAGYAQPWQQGVTPGTGINIPSPEQIAERSERIRAEDPALQANIESARGTAVNPALIGGISLGVNAVARKFGRGDKSSGGNKPQQDSNRTADGPPDPTMGGAPIESQNQNTPGDPSVDDTDESKKQTLLAQLANDFKGGKNGRAMKMMGTVFNAAGGYLSSRAGQTTGGGGAPGTGGSPTGSGMLGGLMGMVGKLSPGAKAAGALGLGIAGFNAAQNIGEKVTEFQQLGSVQGGDFATGMKYEAQARLLALNPFITTQQARQAMQMALKEGFRGDNYDTVQDFMISNFKELGISMGQSMEIMKTQVKGMSEGDDMSGAGSDLKKTINTMKELSAEGGSSLPERINQLQEITEKMTGMGFSKENINRTALGLQEGYGDSMALRDSMSRIGGEVLSNDALITLAGQKAGITGSLPAATRVKLDKAGYDGDEIIEAAASMVAGYVSGFPDKVDRVANFMSLMGQYGVDLDFPEAEALYDKVTGEEKPTAKANRVVARQGKTETGGGLGSRGGNTQSSSPDDANWNKAHGNYSPSENAEGVANSFEGAGRGVASFAPSGNAASPLPQNAAQAGSSVITSNGTVTGTVTITVDSQGRVTAPPVINLTGQQKAAYSGYGGSQLNNPSPGDPNYYHAYNAFSTPGGGG